MVLSLQEVTKRKDAQRDAAATAAELDKLKAQAAAHDRTMSELQATNAAQRAQLRAVQGGTAGGSSGGGAPSGSQLATLETLLERREREVAELRQAVAGRDAQITRLTSTGACEGCSHGAGRGGSGICCVTMTVTWLQLHCPCRPLLWQVHTLCRLVLGPVLEVCL